MAKNRISRYAAKRKTQPYIFPNTRNADTGVGYWEVMLTKSQAILDGIIKTNVELHPLLSNPSESNPILSEEVIKQKILAAPHLFVDAPSVLPDSRDAEIGSSTDFDGDIAARMLGNDIICFDIVRGDRT